MKGASHKPKRGLFLGTKPAGICQFISEKVMNMEFCAKMNWGIERRKIIIGLFYLNYDFLGFAFLFVLKQILKHTFMKLSKPCDSLEIHFE